MPSGRKVRVGVGVLVLGFAILGCLSAFVYLSLPGWVESRLLAEAAAVVGEGRVDLKVRRILRERLAEETRKEQGWIDRNQRDLFAQDPEVEGGNGSGSPPTRESRALPGSREVPNPILTPLPLPPLPGAFPEDRGIGEGADTSDGSSKVGPSSVGREGAVADPPLNASSEEEPDEEGRSE